jgi:hypothetical protein
VIVKVILVFLLVMAVIGIVGSKLGWLAAPRARSRAKFCSSCGRPRIGTGPCPCGKG